MKNDVFSNISKIIERDSKSTTYKFALLRGVIDIIQENSPFISFSEGRVHIPTGLMVEKWLLYYYPILESSTSIPQINGGANLKFAVQFRKIILAYSNNGGFSAFYNDLKNKGIPKTLHEDFCLLIKQLKSTITKMPMKYIGRSISDEFYSIFHYNSSRQRVPVTINIEYLINNFGSFSIPHEYYEAFRLLGSFINGQDSILFKWAEFSVNASGNNLPVEKVLNEVLKIPITQRDVYESKQLYKESLKKEGKVRCVWTGQAISNYDVDHMIPFSVWKNNDLWNLLPSSKIINNKKRDKIPSVRLIEKRKDLILHYWGLIRNKHSQRFQNEIQVSLLGNNDFSSYQQTAVNQLQKSCDYLISKRGFEEWNI